MTALLKSFDDLATQTETQDFTIHAFPALGAEVININLAHELNNQNFAQIKQAHLDHHLLVFRDQHLTPEEQIAFSRRFGPLQIHVLHQFQLENYPEILIISNIKKDGRAIGLGDAGTYWHSDLSYKEIPSLGSLLYARQLPAEGGDTHFANMHLAWETLPLHLKKAVHGKQAEHTYIKKYAELQARSPWRPTLSQEQLNSVKPAIHPIVTQHPETGRGTLFVNENFTSRIIGLPEDESNDLLDELFAHSVRPENIYIHKWQENDLIFWDNRSLIHLAAGTPEYAARKMHRTTVEGTKPQALNIFDINN